MEKETIIWFVVFKTNTKEFLYFDEDGGRHWTKSAFGAYKESTTIRLRKFCNGTNVICVKIKITAEPID